MMTFPFTGKFKVTAIFGASDQELWANNGHEGIDFASQGDKTIVSVTEGTVGWVKRSNKGFGNGKATMDNGYGMFQNMLSYKHAERKKHLVFIDKWCPSSQICHCCEHQ